MLLLNTINIIVLPSISQCVKMVKNYVSMYIFVDEDSPWPGNVLFLIKEKR